MADTDRCAPVAATLIAAATAARGKGIGRDGFLEAARACWDAAGQEHTRGLQG